MRKPAATGLETAAAKKAEIVTEGEQVPVAGEVAQNPFPFISVGDTYSRQEQVCVLYLMLISSYQDLYVKTCQKALQYLGGAQSRGWARFTQIQFRRDRVCKTQPRLLLALCICCSCNIPTSYTVCTGCR